MFAKKHRLAKTRDVKGALSRGRAFFNPFFTLKFRSGPQQRFTIVVSTKVSKKAVVRNRIKRVLREYLRLRLASLSAGDYALLVKPAAAKAEGKAWTEQLGKLLVQAKVIKL